MLENFLQIKQSTSHAIQLRSTRKLRVETLCSLNKISWCRRKLYKKWNLIQGIWECSHFHTGIIQCMYKLWYACMVSDDVLTNLSMIIVNGTHLPVHSRFTQCTHHCVHSPRPTQERVAIGVWAYCMDEGGEREVCHKLLHTYTKHNNDRFHLTLLIQMSAKYLPKSMHQAVCSDQTTGQVSSSVPSLLPYRINVNDCKKWKELQTHCQEASVFLAH